MVIPRNVEAARVASLRRLQILDTPRQECFDRVTALTAKMFGSSIALISLVDESRQWFLSSMGVDLCETSRDVSICAHAIAAGGTLRVSDTLEDERFRSNPMVTGGPGIRSYMGHPIRNHDGELIGTLCVADSRPGLFAADSMPLLASLAGVVEDLILSHYQRVETACLNAHLSERSDRLRRSNRVFKQAEKIAKIGSWEYDIEADLLQWSDETYAICGMERSDPIDIASAIRLYVAEDRPMIENALHDAIANRITASIETSIVAADGQTKRVRVVGEYLDGDDEYPPRLVGIFHDISETHHAQMALQRAADYDSLTGLYSRHAFDRRLAEQIGLHRETGSDFSVLLLDLDGFKDINDTFGHLVGDVILEEISARIAKAIPAEAVAARWGGDEFAVISPLGASLDEATRLGETLIEAVRDHVEISGRKLAVSATCGLAQCGNSPVGRELVRRADLALYHGKAREPGRVHHYDVRLERVNKLRHVAISTVRSALDEERLFAAYQPIVQLSTNALIGFEALMRLNTRSGEKLTATQVLPAILDPILSRDIGERMVDLVCDEFAEIQAAQPQAQFISINATEADLLSRDFSDRLLSVLEAKRIAPQQVTLEITETMLMVNDAASVQSVLAKLKNAGLQIALDDFGTGFSSLAHLRDFPIDKVKIDKSFVSKICFEHQSRLIVQALIAMAKNLGIEVIAEGIETEEQRQLLLQLGCYYGQGYLFNHAETACRLKLMRLGNGHGSEGGRAAA